MGRATLWWMVRYAGGRIGVGVHDIFFNSLAAIFLASYGLPNFLQGFLANERSFLGSPLQPLFGAISDRLRTPFGRRKPLMLLAIPAAVGFLALIPRPDTWIVVAVFLLAPLLLGLAVTAYEVLMADMVVPEQRGAVNGVSRFLGFASSIGFLAAAALLWETQPGVVFALVALSLTLGFGFTLLTVQEPAPPPPDPHPPLVGGLRQYVRDLLAQREAAKYVLSYFVFWFGLGGITPFITRFGSIDLGIPEGETLILLEVALITTMLSVVPAGWLGDRVGKKPVSLWGLLAFGGFILVGSQLQTPGQAILVLALAGLAQAVPTALAYPLFTELVPGRRMGELSGLSTMVWSLAQPLGATLLGALADLTGTLRTVLLGGALAVLLSAAILATVRAPRLEPTEAPALD